MSIDELYNKVKEIARDVNLGEKEVLSAALSLLEENLKKEKTNGKEG